MHLYSIQNYLGLVWPAVDAGLFSAIVLNYVIDTSYQTDSDEQCLSDPSDPASELTSGGFCVKLTIFKKIFHHLYIIFLYMKSCRAFDYTSRISNSLFIDKNVDTKIFLFKFIILVFYPM